MSRRRRSPKPFGAGKTRAAETSSGGAVITRRLGRALPRCHIRDRDRSRLSSTTRTFTVLTRRAAAASKSILGRLPNEILTEVMWDLLPQDLLALCNTSRLLRELATPLLYRWARLSTGFQADRFVRRLKRPSAASLGHHVRELSVEATVKLSPKLVDSLTSVVSRFARLQRLELSAHRSVAWSDLLREASFPQLTASRCGLQHGSLPLLPPFLNRHSATLRELTLLAVDIDADRLDQPVSLPNLLDLTGPCAMMHAFGPSKSIREVFSYGAGPEPAQLLQHLAEITSSSLTTLMLACRWDSPTPVTMLQSVATHLPHLRIFRFTGRHHDGAGRISPEAAREAATWLERCSALATLELRSEPFPPDTVADAHLTHDHETVRLWGASCKSLSEISLHGQRWKSADGRWCVEQLGPS
ncbi:hypothetical protein MSAN_02291700 [Mycena sanguinolenta]|uniref:F-box domain-containing protein n=1 Tax=Mycena sanguinolenta TaxID=230812 RepID=A0A8H7CGK7_9AGAR|nr:hypothetical protein MSAN_02291700 [Mycena sanguinolenta]